jgi:protein-S-isoprenylcysteine O-methyltransferase Ste14
VSSSTGSAVALAIYLVWMAAAFGWRTWVQRRQTGDSGLRLHAERGTVQWWSKLGFVAAIVAGAVAPVTGVMGLAPIAFVDGATSRAIGLAIAVAGAVGTLVTQQAMGVSWRIGVDPAERTWLVTEGPFAVVRNPIFSAMTVTALGLTLLVGNVVAMAALVLLVASLEIQVRLVEEPYLRAVHGRDFTRYAQRVGRFVPFVGTGS